MSDLEMIMVEIKCSLSLINIIAEWISGGLCLLVRCHLDHLHVYFIRVVIPIYGFIYCF